MGQVLMALAMGALAAGGAALAQDGPPRGGPGGMMMRADTNGDGIVSRAEYQAQIDARFARRDADGNGRIDQGEDRRGPMARADGPPRPPAVDNGAPVAGVTPPPPAAGSPPPPPPAAANPPPPASEVGMTRDQVRARAMERFDRLDANRDGRLDPAEMQAAMPPRGARGGRPPAPAPAG